MESAWELWVSERDVLCGAPDELPAAAHWIAARVPGTVAGTLRAAGAWDASAPTSLHDRDVWYRAVLPPGPPRILRFEGLATLAEVWLDGVRILEARNMFRAYEVTLDSSCTGVLHICFRGLGGAVSASSGRGRWRAPMIPEGRLRRFRTTLLGHMPGWCPPIDAVGPYRPVRLLDPAGPPPPCRVVLRAWLDGDCGRAWVRVAWPRGGDGRLRVAGRDASLRPAGPGMFEAELACPGVAPWWPATHGEPRLHPASLLWDGVEVALPPVGFRQVELDRGADGGGFALRVNGEAVFCRGAVWTSADLAGLPDDEAAFLPWLRLARDAGMNMIRVPGTGLYEADAFYAVCDQLGLLVWQDFAFANMDYPSDPPFLAEVEAEARDFLRRSAGRASLAVLCGGSEVAQQAAMLGLPAVIWRTSPIFDELLPRLCGEERPDVPYLPHTPDGDDLPFRADGAPAHYFGVGGYRRPPEDARLAGVRFASECLALANLPGGAAPDDANVPRDLGASWDFADVRDHYLGSLFGEDPAQLRSDDEVRYRLLSRAISGVLMADVFAQWRRAGSACAGGIVLALQDMAPGAGWGVLDASGQPKPAWHALRQVLAPLQVLVLDEGTNGVQVHLLNERLTPARGILELAWYRDGRLAAAPARQAVEVAPRGALVLPAATVIGGFRDLAHAWRFGSPMAEAVRARLTDADGTVLTEHWLFPRRLLPRTSLGLCASPGREGDEWVLDVRTGGMAQGVHVVADGWRGETEWVHLAPGDGRRLRLVPTRPDGPVTPAGQIVALNGLLPARFGFAEGIA